MRQRARADLRHVEQVAHQRRQPIAGLVDALQRALEHLVGQVAVGVGGEHHLGVALDARDRRAQLVRGDRHEAIARFDRGLRLLVQPSVLDRLAAAPRELLGDGQVDRAS